MKVKFLSILFAIVALLFSASPSFALFDPLSRPNNFHGIHILFTSELSDAAALVNSSNGEWGYVTIPIQVGDKDLEKWQHFMDEARKQKLIPIVRLSTEADPFNTAVWRKPTQLDVIDFANFLNSLNWPIENKYVILFNETNRYDEWGGEPPNPREFADLLFFAASVFKQRDPNFYLIMGGLDNASPNDRVKYMDNFVYLEEMLAQQPELFHKLDAFSSHSYPNPGFVAPPLSNKREGITTYQFEYELVNKNANKKIPAFITETGWDSKKLGESLVAQYYKTAYETIWNKDKDKIVAITPFLLNSQGGTFDIFSFVQAGKQTQYYATTKDLGKVKGEPLLQAVKGLATGKITEFKKLVVKPEEMPMYDTKEFFIEYVKFFF